PYRVAETGTSIYILISFCVTIIFTLGSNSKP
ncbi:MAG: hypothetical protein ACI9WM_001763, partial [Arenicella sp.]